MRQSIAHSFPSAAAIICSCLFLAGCGGSKIDGEWTDSSGGMALKIGGGFVSSDDGKKVAFRLDGDKIIFKAPNGNEMPVGKVEGDKIIYFNQTLTKKK